MNQKAPNQKAPNQKAPNQNAPSDNDNRPVAELGYEQCRDELIEVVRILEQGGLDLDASLRLWERGEALAKRCEEHLDGARARIEAALASSEDD